MPDATASKSLIEKQLKEIGFNIRGWGRTEIGELPHILFDDEEIYEAVNGIYEGGFALMLATDIRVLLIDKKPLNYLSVEDMRYELISEIDYSHRLIGAYISLSSGSKNLKFSSLNQARLRKLIGHVQKCMAETKKKEATHPYLAQINEQLQSYLVAQYKQQQKLQEQLEHAWQNNATVPAELPQQAAPIKPSPQLADYLLAQRLLKGYEDTLPPAAPAAAAPTVVPSPARQMHELYSEGRKEIFAKGGRYHHLPSSLPLPAVHPKRFAAQALRSFVAGIHSPSQEAVSTAVSAPTEA